MTLFNCIIFNVILKDIRVKEFFFPFFKINIFAGKKFFVFLHIKSFGTACYLCIYFFYCTKEQAANDLIVIY